MSRAERAREALSAAIGAVGSPGGQRIWVPAFDRLDPDAFVHPDGTPVAGDEALAAWLRDAIALLERCAWAGIPAPIGLVARARAAASYLWIRGAPGVSGAMAQLAREDAARRGIADVVLGASDWRVWRYEQGGMAVFRRTDERGSARVVVAAGWDGAEIALNERVVLAPAGPTVAGRLTVARVDVSTGRGPRVGHATVGELALTLRLGQIFLEQRGGVRLRVASGCAASADGDGVVVRTEERRLRIDAVTRAGDRLDARGDRTTIEV